MIAHIAAAALLLTIQYVEPAPPTVSGIYAAKGFECVESFPELPQLAKRLHILPSKPLDYGTMLMMCSGDRYSITALINALLDRMDAQR